MAAQALPNNFSARSIAVARKFIQTVVMVDDEAFSGFSKNEAGRTEILRIPAAAPGDTPTLPGSGASSLPPHSGVPDGVKPTSQRTADVPPGGEGPLPPLEQRLDEHHGAAEASSPLEPATAEDVAEGLDARRLVTLFAKEGLVCGVLQPQKDDPELRAATLSAARRADVVILDWIMYRDDGKSATDLIHGILGDDRGSRLRLILIYTGVPEPDRICGALEDALGGRIARTKNRVLEAIDGGVRIVILAKPTTFTQNARDVVHLSELPERVFEEFAYLSSGLLSNVALEGIGVIRQNTHALLGRLHRRLDAAYLTHRMLLPDPEDAVEFASDLVSQEVVSLLHGFEIGAVSGLDAIGDWMGDATRFAEGAAKLQVGDPSALKSIAALGFARWIAANVAPERRSEIERLAHRACTSVFAASASDAIELDKELAFRHQVVERYRADQPAPRLTLGTILLEREAGRYLVCTQPRCDSVRIKGITSFLFLTARKNDEPNLIARNASGQFVKLRVSDRIDDVVQIGFEPSATHDFVCGIGLGNTEFEFASADGRRFLWLAQMKFAHAQRVVQRFSANLARVGFDESEWLRRWGRS